MSYSATRVCQAAERSGSAPKDWQTGDWMMVPRAASCRLFYAVCVVTTEPQTKLSLSNIFSKIIGS